MLPPALVREVIISSTVPTAVPPWLFHSTLSPSRNMPSTWRSDIVNSFTKSIRSVCGATNRCLD